MKVAWRGEELGKGPWRRGVSSYIGVNGMCNCC